MKKLVAAALAALVTTSVCTSFTGCNSNNNDNTTGGSFATLPDQTTVSTDSTSESIESESTSSENNGNSTVVDPSMKGFNILTGEPFINNVEMNRPIAIVVDNTPQASATQTGLDQADILYEALVTYGTTRFVMVSADYKLLDKVSNIREGVGYHMDLAGYHNAVLVCHGGFNTAEKSFQTLAEERYGNRYGFIDTSAEKYFNQASYAEQYGTIEKAEDRKDLKNNIVFKPNAISDLIANPSSKFISQGQGTFMAAPENGGLKFVEYGTKKDLSGASYAKEITLNFKCPGYSSTNKYVSYTYDAEKGKYMRFQADTSKEIVPHVDAQTGEQLGFTNVITLFTNVEVKDTGIETDPQITVFDNKSSGEAGIGYYFTDGKVISISWETTENGLKMTEKDTGADLLLNTGNTYIGYLDQSYLTAQFWQ